jgi:hypothetical protein
MDCQIASAWVDSCRKWLSGWCRAPWRPLIDGNQLLRIHHLGDIGCHQWAIYIMVASRREWHYQDIIQSGTYAFMTFNQSLNGDEGQS